jgi:dTDP-4-dehydrorhamnose reductase
MSKVIILGDGMLGKELSKQTGWDILSRSVDGIDLRDITTWSHLLLPYDIIINCIAYTKTYDNNKKLHWDTNFKAVVELADYCNNHNKKLVHISTDYVYTNCTNTPDENDVPVHQETYYAYTKLLADGYIELKSKNYLILRGTHKPTPFPYEGAWLNHFGNFDYVNVIADLYIKLIKNNKKGIFNVGTSYKSMYILAQETKLNVLPINNKDSRIPLDVGMNVYKLNNIIGNEDKLCNNSL